MTWIHIRGRIQGEMLQQLGQLFRLHPLAVEDVLTSGERTKVDLYDDQLFVVMALPVSTPEGLRTEQFNAFLGPNFLVTFHNGVTDPFELVRRHLRTPESRVRSRRGDYLLYTLLDIIVDQGFPLLDLFANQIEEIEDETLENPTTNTVERIHFIRRQLLLLRRAVWPQREVINLLEREDTGKIGAETKIYLRDCYDHTIQIIDLVESFRDIIGSLTDVYFSSLSNRVNEALRVLTVIATIFIPLTFIAGVYGMNFGRDNESPWAMPELDWYFGYPAVLLLMAALGFGMFFYFKKRKWF